MPSPRLDLGRSESALPRYFVTVKDGGPQRQWTYAKYDDALERAQQEHDEDGAFVLVSRHDETGAMTLSMLGDPDAGR